MLFIPLDYYLALRGLRLRTFFNRKSNKSAPATQSIPDNIRHYPDFVIVEKETNFYSRFRFPI